MFCHVIIIVYCRITNSLAKPSSSSSNSDMLHILSVDFLFQNDLKARKEFVHLDRIGNDIGTGCMNVMELVMKDEPFSCFRLNFRVGFFLFLSLIRSRPASSYVKTVVFYGVGLSEALEDGRVSYSVWILLDCDVFIK